MKNKNKGGRPKGSGIQEQNILLEIAFYYIRMEKNGNVNKFKFATAVKELGLQPKVTIEKESFIRRLKRKWDVENIEILSQARKIYNQSNNADNLETSDNGLCVNRNYEFNQMAQRISKMCQPPDLALKNITTMLNHTDRIKKLYAPHMKLIDNYIKIMDRQAETAKKLTKSIKFIRL